MSGPVRPPLLVELRDNTSQNRPVNTLQFLESEFTLTNTGTRTLVALSGGGGGGTIGGSIADTQVAFGTAADTIGGDSSFTFDATGAPKLKLLGATPRLYFSDSDVSTAENESLLIMKSGDNSFIYDRQNNTPSYLNLGANDIPNNIKIYNNKIQFNDSQADIDTKIMSSTGVLLWADEGRDAVGILGQPSDDVALHVFDNDSQDVLVRLETDENSADKSPTLEFFKNSAADISDYIMSLDAYGLDDGGAKSHYSRIATYIEDETAGTENAVLNFQVVEAGSLRSNLIIGSTLVTINASARNVDFRHLADDNIANIYSDAGTGTVAIRGAANSDSTLTIYDTGTAGDANLELISTQDDLNAAPIMQFFRDDIPSASDQSIGEIEFYGRDLGGSKLRMAQITAFVNDATIGGVESTLKFQTLRTSAARELALWDSYMLDFNPSGKDIDFRIRSDNVTDMFRVDAGLDLVGVNTIPVTGLADNNPKLQVDGSISGKMPVIVANANLTLARTGMSGQTYVCTDGGTTALTMPLGALQGDYFYFVSSSGGIQIVVDLGTQTLNGGTTPITRSTNNEIYTVLCIEDNKFILSNPA